MSDALSFLAGFTIGFLGGFLPGLHSNTIISVLASLGLEDRSLALMIIALFPAHMITSFVPSIFFGVPESSTVVAALPGQRMVRQGKGILALKVVLLSCVSAALASAVLFDISLVFFPIAYGAVRGVMKYILVVFSLILISRTRDPLPSASIFLLSGILGYFTLNSGLPDPFLPLFSGMFAMAALIGYKNAEVPEQHDGTATGTVTGGFAKYILAGIALGMLADLLPGISSPSQVAVFAGIFMPMETLAYLATISSISVSQAVFSISTSASIGKSRSGAVAWLSGFIDIGENLVLLVALFALSVAISAVFVYLGRKAAGKIASSDFSKIRMVLGAYLVAITLIIDGLGGIAVLAAAILLGLLTLKLGIERTNLMGAIIIPTLMLLFGIFL
jgi:putative membrane protein